MSSKTLRKLFRAFTALSFRRAFNQFVSLSTDHRFSLLWRNRHIISDEATKDQGFDNHYVYHTAWAARVLARTKPAKHLDFSSAIYFNAIASAFVPIEFHEFRSTPLRLSGLESRQSDLLQIALPSNCAESISCMHVVEHIGLGRYGDLLDPQGDLKAVAELKRICAPNGNILFVVPLGPPTIEFNAHRIYSRDLVISMFDGYSLEEFAHIPDGFADGPMVVDPDLTKLSPTQRGCGCFWFKKTGKIAPNNR